MDRGLLWSSVPSALAPTSGAPIGGAGSGGSHSGVPTAAGLVASASYEGRDPPLPCCPRCGSSEVQVTSRNRAPKVVAITLLRLLGSRSYRCPNCRHHFLDSRRLRSKLEPQVGQVGGSSNTESSN